MSDIGIHQFNDNNLARWSAMGFPTGGLPDTEDVFSRHTFGGGQIVVRRPLPAARIEELFAEPVRGRRNMIEDTFGVGGVRVPDDVTPLTYPVMVRPAGPVAVALRAGVEVVAVSSQAELETAERVIVDGFPRPEVQPWVKGGFIPPAVLGDPGWRTWLARRDGVPGAAAVSYDDGEVLGIYWLATLPEHRGAGLASAVMTSILASRPERASALVATVAGLPLYERLGYQRVAEGIWYARRS
ncbi:GNAT family N-acetyltransferase [Kineosporia babensis]|uniref:GNAT family N-acetyltransferase n=1 Tax=Kineosporia babensis TaxID=499548 RepID=A0A9X1NDC3_9ACTN|nr:GNAT family N-acetyltransferase [Kineosporia babensis]MCD5311671.1 GNAT family N-acetyltransferase [Kineosporia babensis]